MCIGILFKKISMGSGFAFCSITAISLYFIFAIYSENKFASWISDNNFYILRPERQMVQHGLGKCVLPEYNSWDESILESFNPLWGYQEQCSVAKMRSKLQNGVLVVEEQQDYCWGRCLHRVSDLKYSDGAWQRNGTTAFECDVVEARCSRSPKIEEFDYIWVHTQIYENKEEMKKAETAGNHTYDVLLLVIDSTSYSQSNRNLPKTVNYLTKSLGGVEFPFLNRVAENSKPNAVALFLGEIAEKVNRDIFGESSLEITFPIEDLCKTKLDNFTSLQDEFTNEGYVTSFFEDWSCGLYNYYQCKGFERSPTSHTNTPFRIFWTDPNKEMKQMQIDNWCTTKHQIIFDHVGQFVNSYPESPMNLYDSEEGYALFTGVPKFTTLWDTNFGHSSMSSSIGADTILYDFFIKNRKALTKSFTFVMGDHGLRMGSGSSSKLGLYDVNNPMLLVVPPKDLSNNGELMTTIRENSKKLQTHHDIRQTLLDILMYQPSVAYADRDPLDTSRLGSSFLRKQLGERSCRTLPIPLQYCICNYESKDIDSNSDLAKKISEFVAASLNSRLNNLKIAEKCSKWTFNQDSQILQIAKVEVVDDIDVFKLEVALEPNAKFKTIIRDYRNGTMSMGEVDRSDTYGKRGDCIEEASYRQMCDCVKLN